VGKDQRLVLFHAVSVFISFLVGLLAMARCFSHTERRRRWLGFNLVGPPIRANSTRPAELYDAPGCAGKSGRRSVSVARKASAVATPPASAPDDPGALSPREKEILAGIEADLTMTDPALAAEMAYSCRGGIRAWSQPRPPRSLLLIAALLFLILAVLLMPAAVLDRSENAVLGHPGGAHQQQVAPTCGADQARRFSMPTCALRLNG
jgi:hypothetical protein